MGKSAGSPPPPVSPTLTANAQADANIKTAREGQRLGMVNTSGPGGTVTYTADPSAPGGYRQVTSLDPGQQNIYNLATQAQGGALGVANDQVGRISDVLGHALERPELQRSIGPTDFTADREAITDTVWNRAKSRLDPQWDRAEDRSRQRLANQGLSQNSTAYKDFMDEFDRGRNDSYDTALSSAIMAGADEQTNLFNQALAQGNFSNQSGQQDFENRSFVQNQPINQFSALLGSGQVQMPTAYGGATPGVANTDVLGAYGLNASSANNAYNARVSQANATNQGVGQAAAAAIPYIISAFSDRRLKTDIIRIADHPKGFGVYQYRFKTDAEDAPLRTGVMADEVEQVMPEAVHYDESGLAKVNYMMVHDG